MRRWTLHRRLQLLFAGSIILALVAVGLGAVMFNRLIDARGQIINRVDPAAVLERDLLARMLDQENAVGGFSLTADETFLRPYTEGATLSERIVGDLRALIGDTPALAAALDAAVSAIAVWRNEFAEPEIARVRIVGAGEAAPEVIEEGRQRYEAIRASLDNLEAALDREREVARADLERATRVLVGSLAAIALVTISVAIAARQALAAWVIGPLGRVAQGTRVVTEGDLRHQIETTGPPEIEHLARDVDSMRQRIVEEVARLEAAHAELAERAVELSRSNADLEQFAYVASHDLQEPLRKVTSFCQLLQRRYQGQLDERADQYIEFAVDGAQRMQKLINDLLTFARVGRNTSGFVPVEMHQVVARVLVELEPEIKDARAVMDVGELPTVTGDPTLLALLCRNLIGNALKFRSTRQPLVTVHATRDHDDWLFEFADNGIGIEPEYADKIFTLFQRLHPRESYEGTGIGLALAKRVVEFHGGQIWLDTDRAEGTAIRFTIPDTIPGTR